MTHAFVRLSRAAGAAFVVIVSLVTVSGVALAQERYKTPPQVVTDMLDAPLLPAASVSPDRAWLVLADRASMPTIAELAEPMLRLAGARVNPRTNGPHRAARFTGLAFKRISDGTERRVSAPAGVARHDDLSCPRVRRQQREHRVLPHERHVPGQHEHRIALRVFEGDLNRREHPARRVGIDDQQHPLVREQPYGVEAPGRRQNDDDLVEPAVNQRSQRLLEHGDAVDVRQQLAAAEALAFAGGRNDRGTVRALHQNAGIAGATRMPRPHEWIGACRDRSRQSAPGVAPPARWGWPAS